MLFQNLLTAEAREVLRHALLDPADSNDLHGYDRRMADILAPEVDRICRIYFRMEVEGTEQVPEGKALVVGNHEAGIIFPQVLGMCARYYLERGTGEALHALAHDMMFKFPLIGNFLVRAGGVRACHENADALFKLGRKILVFPGGNIEAFRPYHERNRIKFNGRKGFIRLALRHNVPLSPVVLVGGQETFYILHDGQELAKVIGLKRWFRSDTCPIYLGLPWGLGIGPFFHLPLPSKSQVRFLEPICLDRYSPGDADNPAVLEAIYQEVTGKMQAAMDELVAQRRFPVLG